MKIEVLNSGKLEFGKLEIVRDNATKKIVQREFKPLGNLFYKTKNITQTDQSFHNLNFQEIEMKVKTYFHKELTKAFKIRIEKNLFDIKEISEDEEKRYMFLYLSKVKENE